MFAGRLFVCISERMSSRRDLEESLEQMSAGYAVELVRTPDLKISIVFYSARQNIHGAFCEH